MLGGASFSQSIYLSGRLLARLIEIMATIEIEIYNMSL